MFQQPTRRGRTNVDLSPDKYRPENLLLLARLGRELRLLDQICDLSSSLDTVSVVESGPAPAWTTLEGDEVTFAMSHMPMPKSRVDVAVWLGTNAHELGHVLYSPRRDSLLMQQVVEGDKLFLKGIAQIHNIVEDQRQERLILSRFAPWRNYLVAALGHHLSSKTKDAWLLFAGRTWLDASIWAEARAAFVAARNEATARDVAQLIGDYQWLTDPGTSESDEAWDILIKLHTLFDLDIPTGGCGGGVIVSGEPITDDCPTIDAPPTADEADGEPVPGAGEPSEGDDDKDGKDSNNAAPQPPQGRTAGKGGEPPKSKSPAQVKDDLRQQASDGLTHDEDAKADLDSILDAILAGHGQENVEGQRAEGEWCEATDTARRLHWEVGEALLDLKDETEPGWVKGVSNGRLNIRRLLNPNVDVDTLFDRYDPGQYDASELEMALLLDVSGSMSRKVFALSEATWAIRQAVEDIDGRAAVMTFSSGPFRLVYGPNERPDDRMFNLTSWGGTDPESALVAAFHLLAESTARNRLLVILTDGDWYGPGGDKLIAACREAGIVTVLAYMPTDYGIAGHTPNAHGVEFFKEIGEPRDLAIMFRDIALARMGQWLS